ncbi:GntR family transcriptional regulator [Phaeobacter gallaeciensis]|uniref:Transcriptional regulator, GntR family n=1 Tax=Phaeobacter gallaeciensis TaxID=60890 RepID=A0AAC9Z775_9RHOB|nr:GntR family transcriptional regulator [Phaeobacter gallaeciensis]AHD08379.1 transcriptional regulator, GntR family [Phaeobacter gallaeciensis DSM 26640]ATE91645.1 transcriptional regulator, GntR family [Phaeobacter gallaeciensis]ATE98531.1 transcriptional regulator, GntR family [Phaeobacter gallaeciensis]ATF00261.1 transcriptional regulator, GntR family [Phaeobacter gallaeciensis]ATF04693.1 transcriptional regulator, GntR family [Phaeobacter gallaeciensis]
MFGRRAQAEDDTVVAMLAAALRRDISFGVLRPDQKLKIEALRQSYGGSNHSMRETLRMLSAEGLVEATAQRGFRVTSATEDDLRDILFMRLEVERLGLRLGLARSDVQWEGRLLAAHHALRRTEEALIQDPNDALALDWDMAGRSFAAVLVEAAQSPRLSDMQLKFYDQSRRFRLALLREGRLDFSARAQQQQALVEAVLARDTDAAVAALETYVTGDMMTGTRGV